MFSSNYVKIDKNDWEQIKTDYNAMLQKIKELESRQPDVLMKLVERQSAEIEKLLKYKEQDDALYSYEQTCQNHLKTINSQKEEIAKLKQENERLLNMYQKEANMSSLLANKLADSPRCPEYKTVSKYEIYA